MKKIYLVSAITIILGLLFVLRPHWFAFLWGWQIILLPLISGILMALVQDEDKSYRFLPKLIIGSILTSFAFVAIWRVITYYPSDSLYLPEALYMALFLSAIIMFGGLIGIAVKGSFLLIKENSRSRWVLSFKKILGTIFLGLSVAASLAAIVIFFILAFNPSSSLLNRFMVDFQLIDVIGVIRYYAFILSALVIILIPLAFVIILGLSLWSERRRFFNLRVSLWLILLFSICLTAFFRLSSYTESKFQEKKGAMKEDEIETYFDIKDFDSIYVSRYVKFDDIAIRQGDKFSIVVKGSRYDQIGLDFQKEGDTLLIKRSELETYYNTDTWAMENDRIPFSAGTKVLSIEITMPDIEKIELEGGHIELVDFQVNDIEIKLNKRFNNIKGNITVEDTLKLIAVGGIVNFTGSAKNLVIDSGDCWIEMDEFRAEEAVIKARNTSRLEINVSGDLQVLSDENSGITNHYRGE